MHLVRKKMFSPKRTLISSGNLEFFCFGKKIWPCRKSDLEGEEVCVCVADAKDIIPLTQRNTSSDAIASKKKGGFIMEEMKRNIKNDSKNAQNPQKGNERVSLDLKNPQTSKAGFFFVTAATNFYFSEGKNILLLKLFLRVKKILVDVSLKTKIDRKTCNSTTKKWQVPSPFFFSQDLS